MLTRRLGSSGLQVSCYGLGTMEWGEDVDEFDAAEQLAAFVDHGGTLVDTAPIYGGGAAEPLIGTLLAKSGLRERIVLASKAGLRQSPDGIVRDTSRRCLLDQLDASLELLGVDHLDLWQVHVWDDGAPIDETLSALEYAVRTGRARYVGVGNYRGWQTSYAAARLMSRPEGLQLAGTQVEYSLVRRDIEREVVPAVAHAQMGVIAWSPMGRGILTGKYRGGTPRQPRGAGGPFEYFIRPYLNGERDGVVEAVARAAEGLEVSMPAVALAWVRDRPSVSSVLLGASSVDQLRSNLEAADLTVPDEIREAL